MWGKAVADPNGKDSCDLTVYFDGSCPLCRAEITYFQKVTPKGAIRFEDVSRDDARLADGLDPQAAMARFHVRRGDGMLVSGAAGFAEMWARAPGWRWLARLSRIPGFLWLMERTYRLFLVFRPLLVRVVTPFLKRRSQPSKVPE